MEHLRIFLAILLSFLVFFVWEMLFVDHEAQRRQVEAPEVGETVGTEAPPDAQTTAAPAAPTGAPTATAATVSAPSPAGPETRRIQVENRVFRLEIDERGGVVRHVELKKYRKSVEPGAPAYELLGEDMEIGSLRTGLRSLPEEALAEARWRADGEVRRIDVAEGERQVSLRYTRQDGLSIVKRFTFRPNSYLIGLEVTVYNGTGQAFKDAVFVTLAQPTVKKDARYGFVGPSALVDGHLEQVAPDDIEEEGRIEGKIRWAAIQDRYFLSAVAPEQVGDGRTDMAAPDDNRLTNKYITADASFPSGQSQRFGFQVFFGPKRIDTLERYGLELERAVDFGMFDFIAKPCLWFMNWIHGFLPNYGVAIILLTLLTKVVLWPLGNKSYKSMNDMRRMQPLMTEIREKYKNDKKKMNEEMMNLYRVYKVNPLGGCLPMLVQLPVFLALYRMLYEAIELRHAPFFGWINDLSAPDRLFSFNVTIPLMEPPYGIPVLTLIMGGTMFLQQKMTPTPGDPTQAKMMMWMPIVFTVIFVNFSSGLVLYWLVNNLASIGQQYYIYKKHA